MDDDTRDLHAAVTSRALVRVVLGSAATGLVVGVLAVAFLTLSSNRLDATTVPVVVLLMAGQVAGLAAAASTALRLRQVRTAADPREVAERAARTLRHVAAAVVVAAAVGVVVLPVVLEPTGPAVLTSLVGAGVLAQVVVVLTVLRRPLHRLAVTSP